MSKAEMCGGVRHRGGTTLASKRGSVLSGSAAHPFGQHPYEVFKQAVPTRRVQRGGSACLQA
ncbi:MAG: hypothetical protein LBK25_01435 [Treponema sp.]|nr:hypothetical protein [Treponema sp.]